MKRFQHLVNSVIIYNRPALFSSFRLQPYDFYYRLREVEATEFQGVKLTPIKDQLNNALKGTQIIDKDTYTLTIDGLVTIRLL